MQAPRRHGCSLCFPRLHQHKRFRQTAPPARYERTVGAFILSALCVLPPDKNLLMAEKKPQPAAAGQAAGRAQAFFMPFRGHGHHGPAPRGGAFRLRRTRRRINGRAKVPCRTISGSCSSQRREKVVPKHKSRPCAAWPRRGVLSFSEQEAY